MRERELAPLTVNGGGGEGGLRGHAGERETMRKTEESSTLVPHRTASRPPCSSLASPVGNQQTMANPPPSFSSFPDLPAPPPPPPARSSSSRRGASSSRRSRSPEGSRKGKSRDKDDDHRQRETKDRDSKHRRRRHEKEYGGEPDRRREEPSSSHSRIQRRRSRSRSPHQPSGSSSSSRRETEAGSRSSRSSDAAGLSTSAGLPVVSELYYAAGRGDEANVTFGSLHKYSLAKFFRAGGESVALSAHLFAKS